MNKEIMTIDNLEKKIENLLGYFSEYPNETNKQNLNKIQKDLNNQEYKIAVVANMSSGKSTFINALFGIEVLPAFNHATTDSATFVYSEPNIEKRAVIYFSDEKKPVEIKDELEREIKQYAQKDEECKDNKYKNVEKIELYYPFKNLQTSSNKDFKITFIDTPGPNSTGESYKQKHKDQTRSVLNDVDLALFMFDYTQLDANLSSDEQGLWNTIKKRHEKDENFDVYFILNKIDEAFSDNFQEVKTIDEAKEKWFFHENKAIKKLEESAKRHGVLEPKIYPISSKYQLLSRNDILWNSPLESFQKKFKDLFLNKWESKSIEYMGISKLEDDINDYINTSVKDKILTKVSSQINNIYYSERERLEVTIQTLEKPKEEAEENLEKAEQFLESRALEMQKEMKEESDELEKRYISQIENVIDTAIEKELIENIDFMSKQTIAFAQAYALDGNVRLATKKSKVNASTINLQDNQVKIEVGQKVDIQIVTKEMQTFMQILFEDYKRNYLDSKSDIKEQYFSLERKSKQLITKYQDELQEELENTLSVKIEKIETQQIDYGSIVNMDIKVPNSILDYSFKKAEYQTVSDSTWYKPWTWGDTRRVRVSDEKHFFSIEPKELKQSIENSMNESINKFLDIEKRNHKEVIKSYLSNNFGIFQDFRHNKISEMDDLKNDINTAIDSLQSIKDQYKEFKNLGKIGK